MKKELHILVTGHRPNRLNNIYDPDKWKPITNFLVPLLVERCNKYDSVVLIDGFGDFWDLVMLFAGVRVKEIHPNISLHGYIPYPNFTMGYGNEKTKRYANICLKKLNYMKHTDSIEGEKIFISRDREMANAARRAKQTGHDVEVWTYYAGDKTAFKSGTGATRRLAYGLRDDPLLEGINLSLQDEINFYDEVRKTLNIS